MTARDRMAPGSTARLEPGDRRIDELERKLASRDKTIAALMRRAAAREESATSPLAVLEQSIALGKIVAMKTRELIEERQVLKEALSELGKAQAMLLQAQKMESIGQLAAGVAHEINTPTQYVRDNVAFVAKASEAIDLVLARACDVVEAARAQGTAGGPIAVFDEVVASSKLDFLRKEFPEALAQSLEGLDRVARIVAAMKDFSHPSAGQKEPVDLRNLINTTITVAQSEWRYIAALSTEFDEDVPAVSCLRDEIGQVILNLVVNAAHAVADSLQPGRKERGRIVVSLRSAGHGHVEIRVEDDGLGIPVHVRERVFDPFFTTKEVGRGTGQGLAIAYATVVEKHKGRIFFETEPGVGTTFVVRLPVELGA